MLIATSAITLISQLNFVPTKVYPIAVVALRPHHNVVAMQMMEFIK